MIKEQSMSEVLDERIFRLKPCTQKIKVRKPNPKIKQLIFDNPVLPNLRQLDIQTGQKIDLMKLRKYMPPYLTILKLNCNLRDACFDYLHSTSLQIIEFPQCKIEEKGAYKISQINWPSLLSINLRNNDFSQGAKGFSKNNWLNLQSINLHNCQINLQGVQAIVQARWPHLISIDLSYNEILSQGAIMISQSNWTNLQILNLSFAAIESDGVKALASGNLLSLKKINLAYNKELEDQSAYAISHGNLQNLTEIDIQGTDITIKGLQSISDANWHTLKWLNLNKRIFNGMKEPLENHDLIGLMRQCDHIDMLLKTLQRKYPQVTIQS